MVARPDEVLLHIQEDGIEAFAVTDKHGATLLCMDAIDDHNVVGCPCCFLMLQSGPIFYAGSNVPVEGSASSQGGPIS